MDAIFVDIFEKIVLPILTLIGGWFLHLFRSKQKKEQDILANVQQILEIQKNYIAAQDADNKKTRNMNARLERWLKRKEQSIRQANKCPFTSEGDGCPVLLHEDYIDEKCEDCYLKEAGDYDKGQN